MKRYVLAIVTAQRHVRWVTTIFLFLVSTCYAFADGGVRTVALSGLQAPGTAAGIVFSKFGFGGRCFVFNNRGQVAFYGVLSGSGTTQSNNHGTWTEGRGSGLALLARAGDQSPGRSVGTIIGSSTLDHLQLNNAGVTAIGEHNSNFWTDNGTSTLQLIAQNGVQVPGIPNAVFGLPEGSLLNDLGRVTIPGAINSNLSLFVYDPADGYHVLFQTVAGQAPGLPDGVLIDPSQTTGLISGAETNSGRFYVVANLTGLGVDATNSKAFWVSDGAGATHLVIRNGDPAPGVPSSLKVNLLMQQVNGGGQYAFLGQLIGVGISSTNNRGIWTGDGLSPPQLAMHLGDHAPGTQDGVVFAPSFFPIPLLFNDHQRLAFNASLSGNGVNSANDSGMWLGAEEVPAFRSWHEKETRRQVSEPALSSANSNLTRVSKRSRSTTSDKWPSSASSRVSASRQRMTRQFGVRIAMASCA